MANIIRVARDTWEHDLFNEESKQPERGENI
jgi:hypothetical protein